MMLRREEGKTSRGDEGEDSEGGSRRYIASRGNEWLKAAGEDTS